jgi:hypothetical protein
MLTFGRACLVFDLALAVFGIAGSVYGARRERPEWAPWSRRIGPSSSAASPPAF